MDFEIPEEKGSGSGTRVRALPGGLAVWAPGRVDTGAGLLSLPLSVPDLVTSDT